MKKGLETSPTVITEEELVNRFRESLIQIGQGYVVLYREDVFNILFSMGAITKWLERDAAFTSTNVRIKQAKDFVESVKKLLLKSMEVELPKKEEEIINVNGGGVFKEDGTRITERGSFKEEGSLEAKNNRDSFPPSFVSPFAK